MTVCASTALLATAALVGCASHADRKPADSTTASAPPPVHEHVAPHGGQLVELGEEFAHIELVVDRATGNITAYTLDGEAEQPVRVAQSALVMSLVDSGAAAPRKLKLDAVANALTGETLGATSMFAATNAGIRRDQVLQGTIDSLFIRGRSFTFIAIQPDSHPTAPTTHRP